MKNEKKFNLAEKNRLKTTEKVKEALNILIKSKKEINVSSVAKEAKISRKTISTNRPDLKAMIEEASSLQRDLKDSKVLKTKSRGTTQSERLNRIREKNKVLIEEKKMILEQNLILTQENTKLRDRLADLEEKLYSQAELKIFEKKKLQ